MIAILDVVLQSRPALPSYGTELFRAVLALLGVCVLAWAVLRMLAQRGFGRPRDGRIRLIERVPLDGRRALVLIEVDGRTLLIGFGDTGAPTLLTDLPGTGSTRPTP